MQLLEDKILKFGKVYPGNVLKVDSFLNHQVDMSLIAELAKELYNQFKDCAVTKVITVEASGIPLAGATAQFFNVPMVYAKKSASKNMSDNFYCAAAHSYTHGGDYEMRICKDYLHKDDRVLIIDDFLASGKAIDAITDIINQANAAIVGAGIAIEKGFQHGGDRLRANGIKVVSLAIIDQMNADGTIAFRPQ